jgi:hypothetical protein
MRSAYQTRDYLTTKGFAASSRRETLARTSAYQFQQIFGLVLLIGLIVPRIRNWSLDQYSLCLVIVCVGVTSYLFAREAYMARNACAYLRSVEDDTFLSDLYGTESTKPN